MGKWNKFAKSVFVNKPESIKNALFNGESIFQYVFKKPEKRIENRPHFIIGVADGVYHSPCPRKASKAVMEALKDLKELNVETIAYLQDKLSEDLADRYFGSATTLVAAEINQIERKAKILSVGDSRAYLISKEGEWKQMTEDHSILSEIVELKADQNPNDYASIYGGISSCLVADNSIFQDKIFFKEIDIKEGETLLLCTDGLTDGIGLRWLQIIWGYNKETLEKLRYYQEELKEPGCFYDDMSVIICKLFF